MAQIRSVDVQGAAQRARRVASLTMMLLAASMGASPALIGLLAALFGLVGAVLAVHMGRWIDRCGPRKPIMLASLMVTTGAVVAGVWRDLPALFVAAPLMGTYNSMFLMTTHQTVGRYGRPEDRPANFTVLALGISVAIFVGPLLAGVSIDHLGYANAFFVTALFGFAPMVVVWLGLIEFPPAPSTPKYQPTSVSGWALLIDPELRRAYIAAASNNAIWSIWGFILPLYGHSIELSATAIGTLSAALSAGTLSIRLVMNPLVRRYQPWPLIVVSHIAIALGFLAMPLTRNYAVLGAIAFLMGVGLGLTGPLANAVMYDASPPDKVGEVIGLRMTMANLAQTLVPLLSGAVGAALGVAPVFGAVAAAMLAGAWVNRSELRQ